MNNYPNVTIAGEHIQLGDSFQTFVQEKINRLNKYNPTSVHIALTKVRFLFVVSLEAHTPQLHVVAKAEHEDPYHAFQHALREGEKQLRRKKRQKNHHAHDPDQGV